MDWMIGLKAAGWGALSSISLPLGAVLGLWLKPGRKVTSAMMAFGGGALLFALTLELFGESIHEVDHHGKVPVYFLMVGAIAGGAIYEILNQILNNKGGFLRKFSTTKRYVSRLKWITATNAVKKLGKMKLLRDLSPSEVILFIPYLKKVSFSKGDTLIKEGTTGGSMYFIDSGEVVVSKTESGQKISIATLKKSDVVGEMSAVSGATTTATVTASTDTEAWMITHENLKEIFSRIDKFKDTVSELAGERLKDLSSKASTIGNQITSNITEADVQEQVEKFHGHAAGGGAAMAIWMGIFLDGIPESLVIGTLSVSEAGMSLAFIAGVFLANFPEALSSSVGMKKQGMKFKKIFWMWMSLTILTSFGAFAGAIIFSQEMTHGMFISMKLVEGVAAGAMLAMIAETMLPEAFEQGGAVVGMSTLMGFLSALLVKLLE